MAEIRLDGDPVLRERCAPWDFGHERGAWMLAEQLERTLLEANETSPAAGLAAPQIGIAVRAIAVRFEGPVVVLFNPVIVARLGGQGWRNEGCLSFPGVFVRVRRYVEVDARWQDADGLWRERRLGGVLAHAFQHELDHLEGRTLRDLVPARVLERA